MKKKDRKKARGPTVYGSITHEGVRTPNPVRGVGLLSNELKGGTNYSKQNLGIFGSLINM